MKTKNFSYDKVNPNNIIYKIHYKLKGVNNLKNLLIVLTILLEFVLNSDFAFSQNVFVTGAVVGNGSYPTLSAACNAINAFPQIGANINMVININTTEPAGGVTLSSNNWSRVNIQPNGLRTISGAATAGQSLIDFNGADRVTINGIDAGGNSLTIMNTTVSSVSGTSTIRFRNDATNNRITRCSILGSSTSAVGTPGGNIWFAAGATSTGNDNNVISYCDIGPAGTNLPSKGIYFSGTTTSTILNNGADTIIGCNIYNYFRSTTSSAGIYITSGSTDITIKQNKFYQTAARVHTANSLHTAVSIINTSGNNYAVDSNLIGSASSTGTGVYTISGVSNNFKAINLRVGSTTPSSVQGNIISKISHSTADDGVEAASPCVIIHIDSGIVNVGNVVRNLIGNMSSTGNITYASSSANTSAIIGIANFGAGPFLCNGNLIGGITASNSSTGACNIYGIRVSLVPTVLLTCQENIIGGAVNNSIHSTTASILSIVNGISYGGSSGQLNRNNIKNLTASGGTGINDSASVIGININAPPLTNHNVSGNIIHTLTNSNSNTAAVVTGILAEGNSNGSNLFESNFIYTFHINNNSSTMNGIEQDSDTATFQNNMIRLGINAAGNSVILGAKINGIIETNGSNNFYFNSVYIGGSPTSGAENTYAFKSNVVTLPRKYLNNIFCNARSNSGSTGRHYAVSVGGFAPPPPAVTMDYNVFLASGAGGVFGQLGVTDVPTLAFWQAVTGQDPNSYVGNPQYINPNGTVATVDLHINFAVPTIIESHGFAIAGIVRDIDFDFRPGLTPTDIGADAGLFLYIPTFTLSITMFIEGFYDDLTNTQVPDTVRVILREAVSPYNIVDSADAWVPLNGNGNFPFDNIQPASYYIVIKHRNSIETWSATAQNFTAGSLNYNFSTSAGQAFGNNMKQVDTAPVRFGIYSGDVNQEGVVDGSDAAIIDNDAFNFVTGYVVSDLTGDDVVDGSDAAIADNNAANFVSKITP